MVLFSGYSAYGSAIMAGIPLLLVISLSIGTITSQLTCTQVVKQGWTIDSNAAVQNIAQTNLLNNIRSTDVSACVKECCDDARCTVAVFEQKNKRCLVIDCKPLEKCAWVQGPDVTSLVVHHSSSTSSVQFTASGTFTQHSSSTTLGSDPPTDIKNGQTGAVSSIGGEQKGAVPEQGSIQGGQSGTDRGKGSTRVAQKLSGQGSAQGAQSAVPQHSSTPGGQSATASEQGATQGEVVRTKRSTTHRKHHGKTTLATQAPVAIPTANTVSSNTTKNSNFTQTAQTILNLAYLANITDTDLNPAKVSRAELNNILGKLVIKTGSSEFTSDGAAFTVSQLTQEDVNTLVQEVRRKLLPSLKTTSMPQHTGSAVASLPPTRSEVGLQRDRGDLTESKPSTTPSTIDQHATVSVTVTKQGAGDGTGPTNGTSSRSNVTHALGNATSSPGNVTSGPSNVTSGLSDVTNGLGNITTGPRGIAVEERAHELAARRHLAATREATLIATLTVGCIFMITVFAIVGKRFYANWQRRHYSKIDHLINGIYN